MLHQLETLRLTGLLFVTAPAAELLYVRALSSMRRQGASNRRSVDLSAGVTGMFKRADEQVTLFKSIEDPKACANARAAQLELIKWRDNIRRLMELKLQSPPLITSYCAMESIFIAVFGKADADLHV